jgi:hypothetical protein
VEGKDPLDADPETQLADRERGAGSGAVAGKDQSFEYLNPLPAPFDNTDMDLDRVSGPKLGDVVADVRALN